MAEAVAVVGDAVGAVGPFPTGSVAGEGFADFAPQSVVGVADAQAGRGEGFEELTGGVVGIPGGVTQWIGHGGGVAEFIVSGQGQASGTVHPAGFLSVTVITDLFGGSVGVYDVGDLAPPVPVVTGDSAQGVAFEGGGDPGGRSDKMSAWPEGSRARVWRPRSSYW